MTDIEELKIIEDIKKLKARYCRLVDLKDWPAFEALFAEDASFDVPKMEGTPLHGRGNIISLVRKSIGDGNSLHVATMPDIEVIDDDTAQAVWALETIMTVRARPGEPAPRACGLSHDLYTRRDGSWRVQSVRLQPLPRV